MGRVSAVGAVTPLLCAGITTYSPSRHWKAGPGKAVGVVGIGGLGHMGIKLPHAMSAHLGAFTTSESKPIAGSMIGGIPETQEMLDFCAERGIVADIETICADAINRAYERMLKGDLKYRFVIDAASPAF